MKKEKVCAKCQLNKSSEEFYIVRNGKYIRLTSYCKICTNQNRVEQFKILKQKCVEYKGGKCQKCGYNRCYAAMDFHHTDMTEKDFEISDARGRRFDEKTMKELDKCILLCSNCHREIHNGVVV